MCIVTCFPVSNRLIQCLRLGFFGAIVDAILTEQEMMTVTVNRVVVLIANRTPCHWAISSNNFVLYGLPVVLIMICFNKLLLDATGWVSLSPCKCSGVLREMESPL